MVKKSAGAAAAVLLCACAGFPFLAHGAADTLLSEVRKAMETGVETEPETPLDEAGGT